ncbi:nuclease-related domain-containing protein [Thalassobacillus sp. CUG 92003]|uniref:nuclease-related domain-containing protein n=1 Tax=Thalassobacillus sp. CUG 92003 TaxID=2736641 RepID=UPI0015E6A014|nr:nuclease-related domain-containing protein [Thalassobacillus sp. CUG 92003]
MIIKQRQFPHQLRQLEALHRRLPSHHPKLNLISEAAARKWSGYQGETSLDFHLDFLPPDQYLILKGLRLFDGKHFFQLDTVLVSRSFLVILEVKNISGYLTLDRDIHQLTRQTEGFADPVIQIDRQQQQLKQWVAETCEISLPVESFVLFTHPKVTLGFTHDRILKSEGVAYRLKNLMSRYSRPIISTKQMEKIARKMAAHHSDLQQDILLQYEIQAGDLVTGVYCENCAQNVRWYKKRWHCQACGTRRLTSHHQALQDYALLISPTISNREARSFLRVECAQIVKRLLINLGGNKLGANKNRTYEIPITKCR